MSAPDVALKEQVACVKREISMRKHVYPRWVATGRMTQEKADAELAAMQAVLATVEQALAAAEPGLF